eukprot:56425_1
MDLLRNRVINEHYQLIQQLEQAYTEKINELLKQKALIHLALQQTLYSKLLEINTITESSSSLKNETNPSNIPSFQHVQTPPSQNAPIKPMVDSGNLQGILEILQQLDPNALTNTSDESCASITPTSNPSIAAPNPPLNPLFRCEICNVQFQKEANFTFHLSMHKLQNAMFSQFPENYMNQSQNNNAHAMNAHPPIKQEERVLEPMCTPNQSQHGTLHTPDPPSLGDIREHPYTGGSIKIKPFRCTKCGKYFRQKRELNRHIINKHTPNHEKPFKCRFCKYGAATKSIVQRHEYTHSTTKPYRCNQCNYQTSYKYILKKHVNKVHNGEEKEETEDKETTTWKCAHCNAGFASKYLMKQHEAAHGVSLVSENHYQCDQCSFRCAHKHSLIGHKLMHNQTKPFLCNICHKKFVTATELSKHAQTHQSIN